MLLLLVASFVAPALAQATTVLIQNTSDWTITRLYLSPSSSTSWGADQLGSQVLSPGNQLGLNVACDTYDVQLIDEDGDKCVVAAVPLCGGAETWTFDNELLLGCQMVTAAEGAVGAEPEPPVQAGGVQPMNSGSTTSGATYSGAGTTSSIKVVNRSLWSIYQLYLSPSSSSSWGDDQLGSSVITNSGGTFSLSSIPCDSYDVKLVDEDGDVCVVTEVPLCGGSEEWVITDDALLSCQNQ
jgi:hypothetical protein